MMKMTNNAAAIKKGLQQGIRCHVFFCAVVLHNSRASADAGTVSLRLLRAQNYSGDENCPQ
jgi:hypothetical protein